MLAKRESAAESGSAAAGRGRFWGLLLAGLALAALGGARRRPPSAGARRRHRHPPALPQDAASVIQTCLAVIRGHCEMVRRNGAGHEKLAQRMDMAIEAVDEAATLVRLLITRRRAATSPPAAPRP